MPKVLGCNADDDVAKDVIQLAKAEDRPVSYIINRILKEYFANKNRLGKSA